MSNVIKGFKVFNPDWTCRNFQYKVGETYHHNGEIGLCEAGFHFCQVASDCFSYYSFNPNNKVAEVEAIGLTETQGNKSVTNCIRIIREIPWQELLTIVNTGKSCTGFCNSGNNNSGNWNSGNWNSGNWNSGNWNSGNWNSGNNNSGNWNSGNNNSGNWNNGFFNSGDCNNGDWNSGNNNSGNWNSGNWNSGNWNSGNRNNGFFNTDEPFARSFNKPTKIKMSEFCNIKGVKILARNYENNWWIYSGNMSEEEKAEHPEHVTTGGYLKTVPFHEACRMMWERLSDDEKAEVLKIPNFDSAIFEEITGIKA